MSYIDYFCIHQDGSFHYKLEIIFREIDKYAARKIISVFGINGEGEEHHLLCYLPKSTTTVYIRDNCRFIDKYGRDFIPSRYTIGFACDTNLVTKSAYDAVHSMFTSTNILLEEDDSMTAYHEYAELILDYCIPVNTIARNFSAN